MIYWTVVQCRSKSRDQSRSTILSTAATRTFFSCPKGQYHWTALWSLLSSGWGNRERGSRVSRKANIQQLNLALVSVPTKNRR